MFLVEVHSPNAMRSRSRGVLSLNTAAMSSSMMSEFLLSVRMGTGPIFAQPMMAVNPLFKRFSSLGKGPCRGEGLKPIFCEVDRPVEGGSPFCYHDEAFQGPKMVKVLCGRLGKIK